MPGRMIEFSDYCIYCWIAAPIIVFIVCVAHVGYIRDDWRVETNGEIVAIAAIFIVFAPLLLPFALVFLLTGLLITGSIHIGLWLRKDDDV